MWDKPPHAEILIGDKSHFTGDITGTEDKPNVIEFEHEFTEDKPDVTEGEDNELIIKRSGKDKGQTVVNDNGDVLKDQLLHIKIHGDRRDRPRCIGVRRCLHSPIPRTMGLTTETSRCGITGIIQECHCHGTRWKMGFQVQITVLHVAVREPLLI